MSHGASGIEPSAGNLPHPFWQPLHYDVANFIIGPQAEARKDMLPMCAQKESCQLYIKLGLCFTVQLSEPGAPQFIESATILNSEAICRPRLIIPALNCCKVATEKRKHLGGNCMDRHGALSKSTGRIVSFMPSWLQVQCCV